MHLQSKIFKCSQGETHEPPGGPLSIMDDNIVPIWQPPITSSQLMPHNNPIPIVTQSFKWQQTNKHKTSDNHAH